MTNPSSGETLAELLERVSRRRRPLIDLGVKRMRTTLARLGDPHTKLPPVLHVAGTNGKGSTCAYLRAILEASGARVHVYTSPHLVRYNERIRLAGELISDERLMDAVRRADAAAGDDELTFFEALTAAALLAFAETPADYLVLEVGLGGRLDATNVIDAPLAAVVTPVDFDHQHFLGDTLSLIASEKAGVFRRGAPAVVGVQEPEAMAVLERAAERAGARLSAYGQHWGYAVENGRLVYQDEHGLKDLAPPRLLGAHQHANAALSVATISAARLGLDDATISAGLQNAEWPARLQRLKSGPLVDMLATPGGEDEVWLDGGHNPHAGRALAAALADLEERSPKPLVLISGLQDNKDARGFFAPFKGLARAVFATQAEHRGAAAPEKTAAEAAAAGLEALACASLMEAAGSARRAVEGPARFLICGSLYLAGDVLARNA